MSWENFVEDQSIFSNVIISLISQPFLLIVYWYFLGEKLMLVTFGTYRVNFLKRVSFGLNLGVDHTDADRRLNLLLSRILGASESG